MPILVKSDDVRRGRKAKVRHGRLRAAQASIGLRLLRRLVHCLTNLRDSIILKYLFANMKSCKADTVEPAYNGPVYSGHPLYNGH